MNSAYSNFCPKREFQVENGKITHARVSVVVTYYIKLFRTGADRHNDLPLVVETIMTEKAAGYHYFTSKKE